MTALEEKLLLVDGHSMAFRAFYALPSSLTTPDGQPIQAVYGFLGMLFRVLESLRPRYVGVTFDEGRPFRHALYPGYKAGREDIPEEVATQVAHLRRVLDAMEVWQAAGAPFEADDYLATLARQATERALEVVVLSGDRDMFQIAGDGVSILYPVRGVRDADVYDAPAVERRFGVTPRQLADFKALVGDPSDNIPGVRGIGEKGAAKLIAAHGDLEGIYAALDGLPKGARAKLEAGRENAFLSRRLVTLRHDVPVTLDLAALALSYDRDAVAAVMGEYGFESTIERLPAMYVR